MWCSGSLRAKATSAVRSTFAGMSEFQFTQHVNPVTGKMEWKAQNRDDYDYFRDVARSSYADMLHDTERNQMYYKAIKIAVTNMHARGRKAKVLDIGTGTGLLSMMAATAGADAVTAIEVFEPMAKVAQQVTHANGFSMIKVINKHSTEVSIGEIMKERANILVTELFDTELIGEGALEAYQHAHKNLMEEDCIAVPHSATVYVQLVESDIMNAWHDLEPIKTESADGRTSYIEPDPKMKLCPGLPAVHDIQLSQIKRSQFTEITKAVEVFQFEWGSKALSSASRTSVIRTEAVSSGKVQVVLSWWTLCMDQAGDIILSTAPYWYHPSPNAMQWRDHWIQSVYFLPKSFEVRKGETVRLSAFHDAYSLWFDASIMESDENVEKMKIMRPVCDYLPRMLWSRPRLGMLNDHQRNAMFAKAFEKLNIGCSPQDIAICISDATLLPMLLARTSFSEGHIYTVETDPIGQKGIQSLVRHNKLDKSITVISSQTNDIEKFESILHERSVKLLLGEPFFNASLLPWHDLRFWYARSDLNKFLVEDVQIMPSKAHLKMAAVQFDDLWKIRAPVGIVEGFDVSIMDMMISHAMEMQEYQEPEPHALWEYPCEVLSEIKPVMTFDLTQVVPTKEVAVDGCLNLGAQGKTCHAVVLWMDYDLDEEITVTSGIVGRYGSRLEWNTHRKQAVYFLRQPIRLQDEATNTIDYRVSFIPETGEVKMRFQGR